MDEFVEVITKFGLPVLAAAVSYGAIKQDIKNLHEKVRDKEVDNKRELDRIEHAALRAHERLDSHVADYHRGK
jgi:hypothetical protein